MPWFKKKDEYTTLRPKRVLKKVDIPEGMWIRCEDCQDIIYIKDLEQNFKICPKCRFHFKLSVEERIACTLDENSFIELDTTLKPNDPLQFPGYKKKYESLIKEKELREAVISGEGKIEGISVAIAIMDFRFIGGSLASVAGEKITRTIERAIEKQIPVIIISQSGGARMHEGVLSLMQLAKTSAALAELHKNRILFISVLVDPTTAGVMASYASLGDVILAEPKALIGFAGPRVIEQTIRQPLPPEFQKSEFLLKHGMLDMVVDRSNMKETLARILRLLSVNKSSITIESPIEQIPELSI